jgi:toxin-antitoxin system PIN domain toxin
MTLLSFPDVNVWLALRLADHVHREVAKQWWVDDRSDGITFSRFTQISVLRLLTTATAMNGRALSMTQAWNAYDRLFEDSRVCLLPEPAQLEEDFRKLTASKASSPKVWADAYVIAFTATAHATLITFDRALATRVANCVVLGEVRRTREC